MHACAAPRHACACIMYQRNACRWAYCPCTCGGRAHISLGRSVRGAWRMAHGRGRTIIMACIHLRPRSVRTSFTALVGLAWTYALLHPHLALVCMRRLVSVEVRLSPVSSHKDGGSLCTTSVGGTASFAGQQITATCPSVTGAQFVTIKRAGGSLKLGIAEVAVYSASEGECTPVAQPLAAWQGGREMPFMDGRLLYHSPPCTRHDAGRSTAAWQRAHRAGQGRAGHALLTLTTRSGPMTTHPAAVCAACGATLPTLTLLNSTGCPAAVRVVDVSYTE